MPKMKEVRFGVIGSGPRGRYMAQLYSKIKGCRIVALCDRYEALVKQAHQMVGDPNVVCYTDHRKMLREAAIDGVCVVVEPENNAELVCESIEAGKHTMCDVPLAYTIEDCWRIVRLVEKTGLKFQMAEQARYFPYAQAWKQIVQEGKLGKILFAQGEYLHGVTSDRFWLDSVTGGRLTIEEAKNNPRAKKSRFWKLKHPIFYLPHELSPLLNILDDRVVKVSCMSTRRPSYKYDWYPHPDLEVALMHTEKDTIMRLAAGFTVQTIFKESTGYHWYYLMGTEGTVETNRSNGDHMKLWLQGGFMKEPAEIDWAYNADVTPKDALVSGHGGSDYYPMAYFVDSILKDKTPPMDVYKAAATAAPAIVASLSAEQGGKLLMVPDFRPGKRSKSTRG